MDIQILSQENGMAEVSVALPGGELTRCIDQAYEQHKNDPGFQLPREGLDSNPVGMPLMQEAVQNLFSGIFADVMEQIDLPIASDPKVSVVQASEQDGAVFTLSFALRPTMKLGRYKGIHVKMPDISITEAEYQQALEQVEAQNLVPRAVDRPAALGDTTVIDFEGFRDGVAFDGGTGKGFLLTLGSGQFIPGFEEQLVGAVAGDQVDVNVTFPEQYHAKDLAGQPALFKVTVHEVRGLFQEPLSDEQKAELRESVAQRKKQLADQAVEDQVLKIILEEAEVTLPQAMIESEANICVQQFAAELSAQSMTFDQFCQQNGKDYASVMQDMMPLAERRIRLRLVLAAIAEAEGFTASEEEVEEAWDQMAVQYGVPVARLRESAPAGTEESIRADIASQKAYTFLRENTILDRD